MKFLLPPGLLASLLVFVSFIPCSEASKSTVPASPLASYSAAWNDAKYLKCNTAAKANYMSATEKEVIYILNLARTNPALFTTTVVQQYPTKTNSEYLRKIWYYTGLLDTMKTIKPLPLLTPDSLCFEGAFCHAANSGKEGYFGHQRSKAECQQKEHFRGECCDYGHNQALDILMSLLIDEGVPSLGHRDICLTRYNKIGVAIQPHSSWSYVAVLDFFY